MTRKWNEKVRITDGEGLFEVRGGQFDCALLFKGEPLVMRWDDCAGSVGQYFTHSTRVQNPSAAAAVIRNFVASGPWEHLPLEQQVGPLLRLFADGKYRLTLFDPSPDQWAVVAASDGGAYPHPDHVLVTTRESESHNADTIAQWKSQIAAGARPIVVAATAEDDWFHYVIDGHHKLAAYGELKTPPRILNIAALSPKSLEESQAVKWIRNKEQVAHYRTHKREALDCGR